MEKLDMTPSELDMQLDMNRCPALVCGGLAAKLPVCRKSFSHNGIMAEGEGFEPPEPFDSAVFKTAITFQPDQ